MTSLYPTSLPDDSTDEESLYNDDDSHSSSSGPERGESPSDPPPPPPPGPPPQKRDFNPFTDVINQRLNELYPSNGGQQQQQNGNAGANPKAKAPPRSIRDLVTESEASSSSSSSDDDDDDDSSFSEEDEQLPKAPPHHLEFDGAALPHTSNHNDDASTASSASSDDDGENVPPIYPPPQSFTSRYEENGNPFHDDDDDDDESYSSGGGAPQDVTNMSSTTDHTPMRDNTSATTSSVEQNLHWDAPNRVPTHDTTEVESTASKNPRKSPPLDQNGGDTHRNGNILHPLEIESKKATINDMSIAELLEASKQAKQNTNNGSPSSSTNLLYENESPQSSMADLLQQSNAARDNQATTTKSSVSTTRDSDGHGSYKQITFQDEPTSIFYNNTNRTRDIPYGDEFEDDRKPKANGDQHSSTSSDESSSFFAKRPNNAKTSSKRMDSLRTIASAADNEHQLSDDVYSMMFLAPYCSLAFLYALFTFGLKMSIYTLILVDLLSSGTSDNPLNAPKNVSTLVRCAQFFMLPVAVAIQEDLVASIALFNVKFRPSEDMQLLPGATLCKWILSSVCRFLDGSTSLTVNFLLLLTSNSVLGLMLNFAALGFLIEIDNVAYHLALEGYLTEGIEFVAKAATKLTLPKKTFSKSHAKSYIDSLFILLVYAGILASWIFVTIKQLNGDFVCQGFVLNFSGVDPFSQINDVQFERLPGKIIDNRVVYRETETFAQKGIMAYCSLESRWTFIQTDKDPWGLNRDDVCTNFTLASGDEEGTFDVTDTSSLDWLFYGNEFSRPSSVPPTFEFACGKSIS